MIPKWSKNNAHFVYMGTDSIITVIYIHTINCKKYHSPQEKQKSNSIDER